MYLGVPGRIVDVTAEDEDGLRMGQVDVGGVARRVCLAHVPDAAPGDHVLVHVGFALTRLDELESRRVLELIDIARRVQTQLLPRELTLEEVADRTPEEICDHVVARTRAWMKEQRDDLTIVVVRRTD
jgi:hydrogenase expression/formation protein HypC